MPETDDGADVPYDPDLEHDTEYDPALDDEEPEWYDDEGIEGAVDMEAW